jgi:hypothetical protein
VRERGARVSTGEDGGGGKREKRGAGVGLHEQGEKREIERGF